MKVTRLQWLLAICLFITSYGSAQDVIDNYTLLTANPRQHEKAEWDVMLNASSCDTSDYLDIGLEMVLTAPSGEQLVLPCYCISGESGGRPAWKAQFAAQETGSYSYYFKVKRRGVQSATTAPVQLVVVATAKKSGIKMKRYD